MIQFISPQGVHSPTEVGTGQAKDDKDFESAAFSVLSKEIYDAIPEREALPAND
ncbi:MAG: hypothetical protein ACP5SH_25815 [Syntrophobacteraceae bacterium]